VNVKQQNHRHLDTDTAKDKAPHQLIAGAGNAMRTDYRFRLELSFSGAKTTPQENFCHREQATQDQEMLCKP
jgi:hypothetical protein